MIYGIGVDLVDILRIERVIRRWGDRFIKRVFGPAEIAACQGRPKPSAAFALRFAAKEAFSKALGLGMRKGLKWRDIEVFSHPSGQPGLRLHGKSEKICRGEGIIRIHVSLSDEGGYGMAMVVLEKEQERSHGSGERGVPC
jgi:holo-[acyl-carrier protein] synthase